MYTYTLTDKIMRSRFDFEMINYEKACSEDCEIICKLDKKKTKQWDKNFKKLIETLKLTNRRHVLFIQEYFPVYKKYAVSGKYIFEDGQCYEVSC